MAFGIPITRYADTIFEKDTQEPSIQLGDIQQDPAQVDGPQEEDIHMNDFQSGVMSDGLEASDSKILPCRLHCQLSPEFQYDPQTVCECNTHKARGYVFEGSEKQANGGLAHTNLSASQLPGVQGKRKRTEQVAFSLSPSGAEIREPKRNCTSERETMPGPHATSKEVIVTEDSRTTVPCIYCGEITHLGRNCAFRLGGPVEEMHR